MNFLLQCFTKILISLIFSNFQGLPPVSQLFACVDKITALSAVSSEAGKAVLDAIEAKLCVGKKWHQF